LVGYILRKESCGIWLIIFMEKPIMNIRITKGSSRAFTLVELLVVISIIAVLLAVLMPSLQKAKQQAESVICKTRTRDIGKALSLYAIDNSDAVPPSGLSKAEAVSYAAANKDTREGMWLRRLVKYYDILKGKNPPLKEFASFKLLRCPSQQKWQKSVEEWAASGRISISSTGASSVYSMYRGCYALNFYFQLEADNPSWANFSKDCTFRRYSQIKQPGGFPLMTDASGDVPVGYTGTEYACSILFPQNGPSFIANKYGWKSTFTSKANRGPAPVHNGKTNYLMADQHCETLGIWPWSTIDGQSALDFHPRRAKYGTPRYYP
jgi:prepilin-type N-terminal cleavage/methylation domain-containing protein/prepilin-type processing-associated H-X9-DG protein